MEFKCPNCGNVFDDTLGVCPACGSAVDKSADTADFVEQAAEPFAQPVPDAAQPTASDAAQTEPSAPSYQYASYSYGAGDPQPQATYQQPYQAQPNYQQPNYQQANYQQANYQQQPYQNYPQTGYAQPGMYAGGDPNAKSKLVAGLLGIFLGGLGVHNFYLGYNGKAIAQLLISILSCGALAPASAIWGLVEGILILVGSTITTDATGRPLGE